MWTRKGTILLASGISLILIGMMISNFQFINNRLLKLGLGQQMK